jgi:DNA-binding response OmpR family regulator
VAGEVVPLKSPAARLARRLHLDQPATVRLREPGNSYYLTAPQLDEWDLGRYGSVIDLVRRQMRMGDRIIDLASRGALLDVVRALAHAPGERMTVQDLVRTVWNMEYHPLRHHSRVTTTMSRIRKLVGADVLEGSREGYRLVLSERWVVIELR